MRKIALALATVAALLMNAPAQAATLIISGGVLTGATGVNVNGSIYNVTFMDGSCNSLFGGCDASLFAFDTRQGALDASQALLDQVFLDGPLGNFDSDPSLTQGCQLPNVFSGCWTLIPFQVTASTALEAAPINAAGSDSVFGQWGGDVAFDVSTEPAFTFAIFSPVAVPEPATWAMMLLGFGAMGFAIRRQKRAALLQAA
jgi:hypothetical protein